MGKEQKQPTKVFYRKRCSYKFHKNLCQGLFFNKVAGLRTATLLKKRLCRRCFPMTFAKFLRTPILQNRIHRIGVLKIAGRILNCAWDCVNLSFTFKFQLKYLRYFITVWTGNQNLTSHYVPDIKFNTFQWTFQIQILAGRKSAISDLGERKPSIVFNVRSQNTFKISVFWLNKT